MAGGSSRVGVRLLPIAGLKGGHPLAIGNRQSGGLYVKVYFSVAARCLSGYEQIVRGKRRFRGPMEAQSFQKQSHRLMKVTSIRSRSALAEGLIHFLQPFRAFQHFTGSRSIRGADDPVLLHQVEQPGGAAISQAEAALQE
jgi:hypothetical protein